MTSVTTLTTHCTDSSTAYTSHPTLAKRQSSCFPPLQFQPALYLTENGLQSCGYYTQSATPLFLWEFCVTSGHLW